jgi:hypothetical protein
MASPADNLRTIIPTTVLGGATGWTPRVGLMDEEADQMAVFYDTGGQNANPRWLLDYPTIQVCVRGKERDYSTAYAKIKEIKDCLLGLEPQDIGGDRFDSVICLGDIMFLGYDDRMRPKFSVNFRCIVEPATNALTQREAL